LENGRLSVVGAHGRIVAERTARREALAYWRSFFEEQPAEIYDMRTRFPGFRGWTPAAAARFVVESDGPFHGLDVHRADETGVWITEGCGQCWDKMLAAWPELAGLRSWHLNDMHAECVHQEARGETWKTHPEAKCPDCGYTLGSAWTKRDLPADVAKLAETVGE
jgi:hypothetical protein